MKPRTLVLRTAGTNCDREAAHAFELAGAKTEAIHINRLLAEPKLAEQFQLMVVPGGFSYGDDIAAGKILANQINHHLRDTFRAFIDAGKPIIGICNGFQVLVKTDLLPGGIGGTAGQTATLTHNESGRFIDRWVNLAPRPGKCIWTKGLPAVISLPIAHGEGKFVPANDAVRQALWANGQVALVYAKEDGSPAEGGPDNPNGSVDDIAGICDATGLVFGLMPHPERYTSPFQHYAWTRQGNSLPEEGAGMVFFRNAVRFARDGVGAGA